MIWGDKQMFRNFSRETCKPPPPTVYASVRGTFWISEASFIRQVVVSTEKSFEIFFKKSKQIQKFKQDALGAVRQLVQLL